MRETLHGFSELSKLSTAFNLSNKTEETQMNIANGYLKATIIHYNHTKRYGFAKVLIPAGTELEFDVSKKDQNYSQNTDIDMSSLEDYQQGTVLDKDITVKAFVHGSTIANAGYQKGLKEDQEVPVKIALYEKGIQITKIYSVNVNSNEERLSNEFLAFVPAKVKMCEKGKFGFVSINHHYETGELLSKPVDAYFNWYLLEKANYEDIEKDDYIMVKYFTYNNGKSSVTQVKYQDKAQEDINNYLENTVEEEA